MPSDGDAHLTQQEAWRYTGNTGAHAAEWECLGCGRTATTPTYGIKEPEPEPCSCWLKEGD